MHRPALLLLVALLVGACGGADDDATDTTVPETFTLSSPAFADGHPIPPEHALGGANTSPPLRWSRVPEGTVELALVVVDPDASNFVHWIVAGLEPASDGLDAGSVPSGAVEARNSFNDDGWAGPAPPAGARHTYLFTLYALPTPSGVTQDMATGDALERIRDLATARAELRAEFEQPR